MTLVPTSAEAREALLAVSDDRKCVADIHAARNADQHRLFFALLKLVADATDETPDTLRRQLLYELGYVDIWFDAFGRMHTEAKSMAYESMPQAEFNRFFRASVHKFAERLQCAPQEIMDRFNEMADPMKGKAA